VRVTTWPRRRASISTSEYSRAVRWTVSPLRVTARAAVSITASPISRSGLAWPALRRIRARRRALSSARANGLTR